jgi:hypothetical protein
MPSDVVPLTDPLERVTAQAQFARYQITAADDINRIVPVV